MSAAKDIRLDAATPAVSLKLDGIVTIKEEQIADFI